MTEKTHQTFLDLVKRVLLTFLLAVIVFGLVIAVVKSTTKEDTWTCSAGIWIKHGHPSSEMPTTKCQ